MGCSESKTEETKDQEKRNKEIDRAIRKYKTDIMGEIKLLLLGTGESGKSTISKQMRILHTDGFSQAELQSYRPVVFNNLATCMKTLIAASRKLKIPLNPENEESAQKLETMSVVDLQEITPEIAEKMKVLWKDSGIQTTYGRRNEFQLMDSASYVFENIDRFVVPGFVPTTQDILHLRAKTSGIVETTFVIQETHFRMVDVGGQRNERKKWIHCFEDVTAIIYCVALNEYDMKLFEDEQVNRMKESLELFEEICNSRWFTKTSILLFLNKSDLFKEKIQRVDLKVLFHDYTGGNNYEAGLKFIREQFERLNKQENKTIYCHVTCATNTENVKAVFDVAKHTILTQNLVRIGMVV